jgi:hypothetical protein
MPEPYFRFSSHNSLSRALYLPADKRWCQGQNAFAHSAFYACEGRQKAAGRRSARPGATSTEENGATGSGQSFHFCQGYPRGRGSHFQRPTRGAPVPGSTSVPVRLDPAPWSWQFELALCSRSTGVPAFSLLSRSLEIPQSQT